MCSAQLTYLIRDCVIIKFIFVQCLQWQVVNVMTAVELLLMLTYTICRNV